MRIILQLSLLLLSITGKAQQPFPPSFYASDSIRISIDNDPDFSVRKKTIVIVYALPNGNTTEQTFGKKTEKGDDWHFDIQHIGAQTRFIRNKLSNRNVFVVYLENKFRSWPAWKQHHPDFKQKIPALIDSIMKILPGREKELYLNGHSGGGSFIFGYLAGVPEIPSFVKRISFLDSNYGYDTVYYPKMYRWLKDVKNSVLNVFSYNDSVVIYNGKPLVSPTGGTWYRSWLMLRQFQNDFKFDKVRNDSLVVFHSADNNIQFYFKTNPEGKIFHTTQVELNGFIHSILAGTKHESAGYGYYSQRAYE